MTNVPVERADRLLTAADIEVRHRARNAPSWIKRRIDAARRERGAPPLWGTAEATRQHAVAKVRQLRAFLALRRATIAAAGS